MTGGAPATADGGGCKTPCQRDPASAPLEEKAFHWLWATALAEVERFNHSLEQVLLRVPPQDLLRQFRLIASLLGARLSESALAATDDNALSRLADRIEELAQVRVRRGLAEPQPSPASEGEGGPPARRPPRHAASRGVKRRPTFRRKPR